MIETMPTEIAVPLGDGIKREFPLLESHPELVYLDSGATSQKPASVLDALDRYYRDDNANVHRSLYGLAERSTAAFEGARDTVARFVGAPRSREIVFTRGTTEGLNLVAYSLSELLVGEGDVILVGAGEHHANLVPWQQAAARRGARLAFMPLRDDGTLDLSVLDDLSDAPVKIAAMTWVSNVFGTINPVSKLSAWCRQRSIPLVLDGAQAVPHMPVNVNHLGADFLAFSGHKTYGPMGSGVVWGKESWWEKMPPWQTGGEMISSVRLESATWNELPYKFEAGTPDVAAAVGLAAACDWISEVGRERIEQRERNVGAYAREALLAVPGITLYGPRKNHTAVFSFNLEGIHSHDVAQYLDTRDIAVRSGHHCAQPAMRQLGIPSTARASLGVYNGTEDVDRLVEGLEGVIKYFA